jgi:hypothetical protein
VSTWSRTDHRTVRTDRGRRAVTEAAIPARGGTSVAG